MFAVLLAIPAASFSQDDPRAIQTWKVQKYDMSVTLPQSDTDRRMTVKATLTIKNVSGKSASSLTLRVSPNAEITAMTVNGATADFNKSTEKAGSAGDLQRIATRFPGISPDVVLTATVDYKLTVKENSGLGAISPAGSQFLPLSFWYPTPTSWFFTRGADFAPFSVKVNGGTGLTAVSSGTAAAGGFEQKYGGQPFFVAGNWDMVSSNGVDVYMPKGVSADGQKRAAELAALFSEARTFAAGILGPAPDEPLRIVATRRGAGFTGGGTVIVDDDVFRRSKIDSQTAMSIAEAAAKIWIGNSVPVSGDAYGAILEGLPRYIATQFIESKYGKDVADVERLRHRTAYAAVSKRDAPLTQASPIDDYYYGEEANKGSMVWRLLARKVGAAEFANILRANMANGLTVAELREAFPGQKDLLDYLFDKTTDMNLLAGLPQTAGGETKVALRNTGSIDATVTVTATMANGQTMEAPATVKSFSFGEVAFKTANKITRVEIDTEKLYPQTEYSDDVAPRETTDTDLLLAVKRNFDKQDYTAAEKTARTVLASMPRYDEVRILLGRSLLALGRLPEAEKEFRAVSDEKLPSPRGLAWASVGLGEIAARSNQNDQALKYSDAAILMDADYGASLAARNLRNKLGVAPSIDPVAKTFFADFGKAAVSNRKAEVDALVMPGEIVRFASGISGSTEQWQATVKQVDRLDADNILVETDLNLKLLTKDPESGLAVFRLTKAGNVWKMSSVDMFEVR